MVIIFRKLRPLGIAPLGTAPLGTVKHFLFFDFLELLLSVSDGELKSKDTYVLLGRCEHSGGRKGQSSQNQNCCLHSSF